ncbi:MAG TPA: tetratricopeptide repeat protein [Patescibacteria group bacterium]|nr:tetratricopeptide repeat protein [Patescibacteria group bacterium]
MSLWTKIFGLDKNPDYERGMQYFNDGKYEEAVAELEKVVAETGRNDPDYALGMFYAAESHAHIGTAKFHAGDLEGALAHFTTAVEENKTYPDLYYQMGVIHHRLGAIEKAVENLERAVGLNNNYFEAICYLGIVLFEAGEKERADDLFKRALEIGADTPSPISKFLSCHLAGDKTDIPPLSSLKELVNIDAEFETHLKEGVEAFNTGDFERAVHAFRRAADIHPEYADIRFKLGLSYLRGGLHEQARRELEAALEINPGYTEARFYLGINFLDQKMHREARPHFERAVSEKPGYADLQCFLGATLFYLGEFEDAKRILEHTLELSPHYTKAQYYYGLLLYTLGERKQAVEFLSEGIKGEERRSDAGMSLALVHIREGNLEEAMVVLNDIVEAGGESADVFYFIGEVYLRLDRMDEAEQFFTKSLGLNGDFVRAKEKIAFILIKRGDYQGAEAMLRDNGENFADLYKIMGDIKFYQGKLDEAERLYRRSLTVNSEYGEALLSLALTLRKKGMDAEAEQLLRKLVGIDPCNVIARNLLGRGPLDLGAC